jgi:hypothetical protein
VEETLARPGTELEGIEDELGCISGHDRAVDGLLVTYSREAKDGGDGEQPVGAIRGKERVTRRGVDAQSVVAREKRCHCSYNKRASRAGFEVVARLSEAEDEGEAGSICF